MDKCVTLDYGIIDELPAVDSEKVNGLLKEALIKSASDGELNFRSGAPAKTAVVAEFRQGFCRDAWAEMQLSADAAFNQCFLNDQRAGFNRKIIVLDDDPTGVQTVHDISVYTDWSKQTIEDGFAQPNDMFFILTNSRSFTTAQTEAVHLDIGKTIAEVSKKRNQPFIVISRGDSTLRGHYPLETDSLRKGIELNCAVKYDGEIICPFFPEGGRYTIGDVHYVKDGAQLIPAGQTEFAKDKSFGYHASNLKDWCAEKTKNTFPRKDIVSISLDSLRAMDIEGIVAQLMNVTDFGKVIVNAASYDDVKVFIAAYLMALKQGKEFIFRSAAALPKVLGSVSDRPLLTKGELVPSSCKTGGIIIVGSHVQKTTRQLEALRNSDLDIHFIEFDQHRVLEAGGLEDEAKKAIAQADELIAQGHSVVVHTRRDRLDLNTEDADKQLQISVAISDALTGIIAGLTVRPRFIIAKGGITSSDVGTKALRVKRANVMGQIAHGIPVWLTGEESLFPGMPFIIFPGNVGNDETLKEIVEELMGKTRD